MANVDRTTKADRSVVVPPRSGRFGSKFTTFSAFRVVSYRWFLGSSVTGVLGFQMQAVALGWLVYILTGSALDLGIITTTQAICQTGISPLGGVIADRVERRTFIIFVRLITVVAATTLGALVLLNRITYPELVIAAGVYGISFGLNGPARQALLAQIVGTDLLINAVSLMSAGMNLMRIIGPAVAGFLIGVIGVGGIYVVLVFLYSAVILQLLPIPPYPLEQREKPKNVLGDLKAGLSYSYSKPSVFGLLLFGTVPLFFAMPYVSLLPIFAEQVWHAGAQGFGILAAAPGVGGLVGALIFASFSNYRYKGRLMVVCAASVGVLLTLFALSPNLYVASFFLLLSGGVSVTYGAIVSSTVQSIIPNEMRGRVMSFYQMSFGISGLSALPASALATAIGAPDTIAICGCCVVIVSVAIYRLRPVIGSTVTISSVTAEA